MEWIEEIKKGNEIVLRQYFKQYQPVVLKASQEFFLRSFDYDDWIQEGFIVFYRSVLNYKENLGVSFGLYFKNNFHRHVISMLRKQQALKRRSNEDLYYLDDETNGEGISSFFESQVEESRFVEEIFVRDRTKQFYHQLKPFDQKILDLYHKGFDPAEMALFLGVSDEEVKKSLKVIHKKLHKELYKVISK